MAAGSSSGWASTSIFCFGLYRCLCRLSTFPGEEESSNGQARPSAPATQMTFFFPQRRSGAIPSFSPLPQSTPYGNGGATSSARAHAPNRRKTKAKHRSRKTASSVSPPRRATCLRRVGRGGRLLREPTMEPPQRSCCPGEQRRSSCTGNDDSPAAGRGKKRRRAAVAATLPPTRTGPP